jgi:hypothetical protein
MNGEQMREVTLFAVALSKMADAAKRGEPVTLTADECGAAARTIRLLTGPRPATEVQQ